MNRTLRTYQSINDSDLENLSINQSMTRTCRTPTDTEHQPHNHRCQLFIAVVALPNTPTRPSTPSLTGPLAPRPARPPNEPASYSIFQATEPPDRTSSLVRSHSRSTTFRIKCPTSLSRSSRPTPTPTPTPKTSAMHHDESEASERERNITIWTRSDANHSARTELVERLEDMFATVRVRLPRSWAKRLKVDAAARMCDRDPARTY